MRHRSIVRTYSAILMAVVFSSCMLGKKYQRPELELPQQFNAVAYADTSSIADIEWKNFFTTPELQRLIDTGLKYNHDLLIAINRIDIAQRWVKQSRALSYPEVNFQASGTISRPSDNSLNGISIKSFIGKSYVEYYAAQFNISWEADIWGKIRGQKEIALAEYLQTGEAAKAVQTQLVADIAHGYFNLLMLDKQLAITKDNLILTDSFVVATRLLKDAGLSNALAVQQAEAQKQATALLIPQLEQSIALEENALQLLTGQLPGTISRATSLDDISLPADLSTGLPAAMVSRRPDVRATELSLVMANAQIGIAQAQMYPAVNLTVGGGLESFMASNWFNIPGSLFGLATGSIAQPVFNRRALKTQYEVAKLERDQAVTRFRQSVLQAVTEVSDALVNVEKLRQQEEITTARADTLKQAVFNARLLFRSDMANYLEVILAQGAALRAELDLVLIQREEMGSIVELYRSLGGGWK